MPDTSPFSPTEIAEARELLDMRAKIDELVLFRQQFLAAGRVVRWVTIGIIGATGMAASLATLWTALHVGAGK